MELKKQQSLVEQAETSTEDIVVTKEEFTPTSVTFIDVDLNEENLNDFLQAVGCDLPDKYVSALCECLKTRVYPLSLPSDERPYSELMVTEEKKYNIRPIDTKPPRLTIDEEIMIEVIKAGVPTVFLRTSKILGKIEFEALFDSSEDDEPWKILDRLGRLGAGIVPSQDELVVRCSGENTGVFTFVGDDISIIFSKNDSLVVPKVEPEIKFEEMWVPYNIQLCDAPEKIEKKFAEQLESEKMNLFFKSGALEVIEMAVSDPEMVPDLYSDLLKMVNNEKENIHFTYNGEIIVQSEDLYDEDDENESFSDDEDEDSSFEDDEEEEGLEFAGSFEDEDDSFNSLFDDDESEEFNDVQQSDSSFVAEFRDSKIGAVTLNVGKNSFFDVIEEHEEDDVVCRTGTMVERRVVEIFWTLFETVSDKAILDKYSEVTKQCVEAVGVTDYEEQLNSEDVTIVSGESGYEREVKIPLDGFSVLVKLRKVKYPAQQE